jgi:hypothetical protein
MILEINLHHIIFQEDLQENYLYNPNPAFTIVKLETTNTINDKNTLDNTDQLFEIYNTATGITNTRQL